MENEHVLSGLIRKRAEIAGELEAAQARVRHLIIDVDNVDATIRLFAPDIDLAEIKPKPFAATSRGVPGRDDPDHLGRAAGHWAGAHDAGYCAPGHGGAEPEPGRSRLMRTIQKRAGAALRHLRGRRTVRSESGRGSNLKWIVR